MKNNYLKKYLEALGEEDFEDREGVERLEEIRFEIDQLVDEAYTLIRQLAQEVGDRSISDRAEAYWIGHISTALSNESGYIGKSMVTFEDTIEELREAYEAGGEEDSEDLENME